MEILFIVIGLAALGAAAITRGADSRPRIGDEPHRSI